MGAWPLKNIYPAVPGDWRQRADERLGDHPQRWIQEPLVVREYAFHSGSALLLGVAAVHCWEISLGLADPWNVIFCLSC